jgi:hypothetical protein
MHKPISYHIKSDKFMLLLASLALLLISSPFLNSSNLGQMIFSFLLIIIPLSGIYAVISDKKQLSIALILAIPFIIINTINTLIDHSVLFYLNTILAILFYLYTIVVILNVILRSKRISHDILFGAISVYLLIGVTWAAFYSVTERLSPRSFKSSVPDINIYEYTGQIDWSDYIYYSFSTLSTVSYGDIMPVNPFARTLSVFEAVTGVFYVAILISLLVSRYVSQSIGREIKSDVEEAIIEESSKICSKK